MTAENVSKHFPQSEETVKGHMNHQRQGVRSTQPKTRAEQASEPVELDSSQEIGKKERDVYSKVVDLWDMKGTIYTDQTGKFPTKARSGSRYIMIMVAIDSNVVLVTALKNKTDKEQRLAYLALLKRLKQAGVEAKKHVLDNECSEKNERTHQVRVQIRVSFTRMPQKKLGRNRNKAFQEPLHFNFVRCG